MKIYKNNLLLLGLAVIIYGLAQWGGMNFNDASLPLESDNDASIQSENSDVRLHNAYINGQTNVQLHGRGVVIKVLQDDSKDLQHQKFVLQTSVNHTVLIAHNINMAERLPGLKKGDTVDFYGEYEWNPQGGVIHWTHRDSEKHHIGGWLKYNGKTYQ